MVDLLLNDDRVSYRLKLHTTTCIIADCVNFKPARRVLQHCINLCEFGDAKFFTHEIPNPPDPYVVTIPQITSKQAYSHFIIKELGKYITTDFVLVVQTDGFIINPEKWTNEFLDYDYIGAPWHPSQVQKGMNENHLVGNGGFSLRSRRLQVHLSQDPNIKLTHPEDVIICQVYRDYLESKGFKFAPRQLANRFSCENYLWNNAFGHHAYFHLHRAR